MHYPRCFSKALLVPLLIVFVPTAIVPAPHAWSAPLTPTKSTPVAHVRLIVTALTKAKNSQDAYRAILPILKELRIGVYTPAGKVVQPGAEKSERDLYLYDAEVRILADGLSTHQRWSLDSLAASLSRVKVRATGGTPLTGETLLGILSGGVKDAVAHPTRARSLAPLLVRELGRKGKPSYDLARQPSTSSVTFDALQRFLIMADALAPLLHGNGSAALPSLNTRRIEALSGGVIRPTTLAGGRCAWTAKGGVSPLGSWAFDSSDARSLPHDELLDALHLTVDLASLNVTRLSPTTQHSHEGPAGHAPDAGKDLAFQIKVEQVANVPATPVTCGPLAGTTIPGRGPVQANVSWQKTDEGIGIDTFGSVIGDARTGADGTATLHFHMTKQETNPGVGNEKTARGTIVAQVGLFSTADSDLSPSSEPMGWEISYHEPTGTGTPGGSHVTGWKFQGLKLTWDIYDNCGIVDGGCGYSHHNSVEAYDWSGRICGSSPFGGQWSITAHHVYTSAGTGSMSETNFADTVPFDTSGNAVFSEDNVHYLFEVTAPGLSKTTFPSMQVVGDHSFQMRLKVRLAPDVNATTGFKITPAEQEASVQVVEDPTCPAS